jgi:hypothetical protein
MTSHLPGLIPITHIHDLSLTWLDTSNTNTWPLTYLAWYLKHKYMTSHLPGLVPLTHIHDLSLTLCFVDRLSFCTFSFGYCVVCSSSIYGFWLPLWYLQTLLHWSARTYMTSHLSGLVPLTQMHDISLTWLDTYNTHTWPLTYLAW